MSWSSWSQLAEICRRIEAAVEEMVPHLAELDDDHLRYSGWNPISWIGDRLGNHFRDSSAHAELQYLLKAYEDQRSEIVPVIGDLAAVELLQHPLTISSSVSNAVRRSLATQAALKQTIRATKAVDGAISACKTAKFSENIDTFASNALSSIFSSQDTRKAQGALEGARVELQSLDAIFQRHSGLDGISQAVENSQWAVGSLQPAGDFCDVVSPLIGLRRSMNNAEILKQQIASLADIRPKLDRLHGDLAHLLNGEQERVLLEFAKLLDRAQPVKAAICRRALRALGLKPQDIAATRTGTVGC